MGFEDDVDRDVEEMWEMEQIWGEEPASSSAGCSSGFWKFILALVIIYWLLDLIFGK